MNSRREDLLKYLNSDPVYLYNNIKFCAEHFEKSQFMNEKCNLLVHDAIPTLFAIRNPPPLIEISRANPMDKARQRQLELAEKKRQEKIRRTLEYIRKEKFLIQEKQRERTAFALKNQPLRKALKAKRQAVYRLNKKAQSRGKDEKGNLERVLKAAGPFLTKDEMLLLRTRLKNARKRRNFYCNDYKRLAVSLSYKSTMAYKFLARRLKLPPKRTVSRWISNIHFKEGFNDEVFDRLKETVSRMELRDQYATLLLDEISLREQCQYDASQDQVIGVKRKPDGTYYYPATALVLMVTGLKAKWSQTLAFFFTKNAMPSGDLLEIVTTAIKKLDSSNVTVLNVTCDQGSNNWALTNLLGANPEKPYFDFCGRKIFIMPDPPHLIKSCRNSLYQHNILTPDGLASWTHLKAFYHQDKLGALRMAKKLTDEHLDPPPIYGKMIVRYATQILSHSVAKGMQACVENKTLSQQVLPTSHFCEHFDTIFDIMNSSRYRDPKPFKRALAPGNADQLQFIKSSITYIRQLYILGKEGENITKNFRWIDGMVMALNTIQLLMFDLSKRGFDFLLTRRLNQDPLENYFSVIRQRNGFDSNPSCYGFSTAFKITIVN